MSRHTGATRGTKTGGFVVAAVGFLLVRFTVLDSVGAGTGVVPFLVDHGVVLILGLGVSLFGIGLAVSTFDRRYVNTVATWCLLGTLGILVITGFSMLDELVASGGRSLFAVRTSPVVAHALVGGAVGGVLIGVRSAANQRQRMELSRRADQLTVLNRIIRHEVLNAGNVIGGHASLLAAEKAPDERSSLEAIERGVDHIEAGVREIGFLTRAARNDHPVLSPIDLAAAVEVALDRARAEHPAATFRTRGSLPDVEVWATGELASAVEHLLDNAALHDEEDGTTIEVEATVGDRTASIRVEDDGPGLPAEQRDILLGGDLPEYDDPKSGFGLPIVRLLTEQFGGAISVDSGPGYGTVVEIELVRADRPLPGEDAWGLEPTELALVTGAAVVAGVAMGLLLQVWTDAVPVIGGLYGVYSLGVGWIMHLFHSIVFGVVFAVAVSRTPIQRFTGSTPRCLLLGVAWGLVLWLFAAGLAMPLLLRSTGLGVTPPLLTLPSLVGHAVWGGLLGLLYRVTSASK